MSKRFFTKVNNKGRLVIIDKECHTELFDMTLACEVLNRLDLKLKTYNEVNGEQQVTIKKQEESLSNTVLTYDKTVAELRKENERIKRENEALESNVKWFAHQLEKHTFP